MRPEKTLCGVNFYTAPYSGMTIADFCFDRKKMEASVLKFIRENPEFDSVYPIHFSHAAARVAQLTQMDLVKLPGKHLPRDVSYQFVEKKR